MILSSSPRIASTMRTTFLTRTAGLLNHQLESACAGSSFPSSSPSSQQPQKKACISGLEPALTSRFFARCYHARRKPFSGPGVPVVSRLTTSRPGCLRPIATSSTNMNFLAKEKEKFEAPEDLGLKVSYGWMECGKWMLKGLRRKGGILMDLVWVSLARVTFGMRWIFYVACSVFSTVFHFYL